ncbi:MAG: sugar transferase [Saccharofermentanales bacterium]|jgi:undecaprenyl phosphate N,N'-diacetylbacillosamine 1-phosphate transferase
MYKNFFKRILDFIIALITVPFILLVTVIIAPIIHFTDGGPVFYNATRRGMNGKEFKMYKFRSMYINSPNLKNADGSTYNGVDDPRVTKIGKILRKTSVDEIPQLFNVLKGDMSLIGPRPTLVTTPYDQLSELSKQRLKVRPGITGFAQAYYRNSISQQEKFKYDCYYIDNLTFAMDVKVLIKTVNSVLKNDNIYVTEEIKNSTVK